MPTFVLYLPRPASKARREPINPFAAVWVLIANWIDRARQRQTLAGLEDHMLRDIGITRVEAARESQKPFWR